MPLSDTLQQFHRPRRLAGRHQAPPLTEQRSAPPKGARGSSDATARKSSSASAYFWSCKNASPLSYRRLADSSVAASCAATTGGRSNATNPTSITSAPFRRHNIALLM